MRWRMPVTGMISLFCALTYWGCVQQLSGIARSQSPAELLVSLPRSTQVVLAAGDRHFAANLSGFRVLVAATERMRSEDYAVQARLQQDIAWFNPAHEDNYYIAAAILPWNGHLAAAQHGDLHQTAATLADDLGRGQRGLRLHQLLLHLLRLGEQRGHIWLATRLHDGPLYQLRD